MRLKAKVMFYCHYPDKLLAPKGGPLRRLYRQLAPARTTLPFSPPLLDRTVRPSSSPTPLTASPPLLVSLRN